MNNYDWAEQLAAAVTICDLQGKILEMNAKAAAAFSKDGGIELLGKNVLDCHPEPARSKLRQLLESGESNVYTIEKNGIKKLIYQAPWFKDSIRQGMVELSIEIPFDIPHFIRK